MMWGDDVVRETGHRMTLSTHCRNNLPAGTNIFISPFMIHHNPDIWENPDLFDPDRFLPENSKSRHPYAYVPFSAGPRNCIGRKFALTEEKAVLTALYSRFTLQHVGAPIRPTAEMVLRNEGPLNFRLIPRRKHT
mmetsp:Transcript_2285/g.6217  ORF Transcript_2285/g.6217 Transcript_2285/m.6217 type:complete len:135 (+) Transcript_2285:225-629(+)